MRLFGAKKKPVPMKPREPGEVEMLLRDPPCHSSWCDRDMAYAQRIDAHIAALEVELETLKGGRDDPPQG